MPSIHKSDPIYKPIANKKTKAALLQNKLLGENIVKRLYYKGVEQLELKKLKARKNIREDFPINRNIMLKTPNEQNYRNINYNIKQKIERNTSCDNDINYDQVNINKLNKYFVQNINRSQSPIEGQNIHFNIAGRNTAKGTKRYNDNLGEKVKENINHSISNKINQIRAHCQQNECKKENPLLYQQELPQKEQESKNPIENSTSHYFNNSNEVNDNKRKLIKSASGPKLFLSVRKNFL